MEPKAHHPVHNSLQLVPVPRHTNPVILPASSFKIILSSHLCPDLPGGIFPCISLPKPCPHHSSPIACHMPRPFHFSHLDQPNSTQWAAQNMQHPSTQIIPVYCTILRPKYPPLHPILKHPQPALQLKHGRWSSTTIEDSRQKYSSASYIREQLHMGLKLQ